MPATSARAPQPNKRKGRTATVQPLQNFQRISATADSIAVLRRQHLAGLGMSDLRASLVADLAWGAIA